MVADTPQSPPPSIAPSTIPTTRLENEHLPAVPSPLNPRTRVERDKRASLKKREAGGDGIGETQGPSKKQKKSLKKPTHLSPIRYHLPLPKSTDFDAPKAPTFMPTVGKEEWMDSSEHVYNRKSFRYTRAIVDPSFPSIQYHRQSETLFTPGFSPEDTSPHILFGSPSCTSVSTQKGFRMARGNVGVREGRYYWECKILSGIKADPLDGDSTGHVRMGWARREAQLDAPVGFDAYSYGFRDVSGEKVHLSRPKEFSNTNLVEGDVIGLELCLPSLSLHRKVVDGSYNKAVDVSDDLDPVASNEYLDIIRDRVPIRYKAHLYFEQFEYAPEKGCEELMNPSQAVTAAPATTDPPNPNHSQPSLRTLPFSYIKLYRNGTPLGEQPAFTDLLAFLPPASKPPNQTGAREGLDDGTLGYYPAISVFRGGAAEANFGPQFWYPPSGMASDDDVEMIDASNIKVEPMRKKQIAGQHSRLRPISERFNEQIAEDIVYDLIDEVDFWSQDTGETETAVNGLSSQGPVIMVDPEDPGALGSGREIKELVQDEV